MTLKTTSSKLMTRGLLLLAVLIILLVPIPAFGEPQTHHLSVDAAEFAYSPARVEVRRGDVVHLTLTASDVVHGFYLDGYDIEERVEPGTSTTFSFTADRTGKFRYRCSVACGPLHPFMIGELVVEPNEPLWRGSAIAVLAVGAAIAGARRRRPA